MPETLTRAEMLHLYELFERLTREHFDAYQSRVSYFTGMVTAIAAATVGGLLQAKEWYHFVGLAAGPVLMGAISLVGVVACGRVYRAQLEDTTIIAKLADELGLSVARPQRNYPWSTEPIEPQRHLETRQCFSSSSDFVDALSRSGYHRSVIRLFTLFIVTAVSIFALVCLLAWLNR